MVYSCFVVSGIQRYQWPVVIMLCNKEISFNQFRLKSQMKTLYCVVVCDNTCLNGIHNSVIGT